MLQPGDTLNRGAYRIERELGAGGFGVVYLAEEVTLRRKVAIKTILSEVGARELGVAEAFYAEARLTARLSHPYIIPIYYVGEEGLRGGPLPYVVMEYVEGGDLEMALRRDARNFPQRIRWMQQIAEGLAYAHQEGVIHRDLKLRNVFVTRNQTVKIGDFGLAKALGTETKTVLKGIGTPGYISPEQIQGRPADARADLYALGIMYYQMCTGSLPYEAPDASDPTAQIMAIAYQHVHAPIPSVRSANPDVPSALDDLIQRLMAKDPAARPPTADAVVQALAALPPLPPPGPIALTRAMETPESIPVTQFAGAPAAIPVTQPAAAAGAIPLTQPAVGPTRRAGTSEKRFNRKWLAVPGALLLLGAGAFVARWYFEALARRQVEAVRLTEDALQRREATVREGEERQARLKAEEEPRRAQAEEEATRKRAEEARLKADEEARQARSREEQRRQEDARKQAEADRQRADEARQARLKADEEARQARSREEQRRQEDARKQAEADRQAGATRELGEWVENTLRKAGHKGLTVAVSPERVVTLTGTVQDQRERDDAVRLAMLAPGVREVKPNITVAVRPPDPKEVRRLVEQRLRENGLNLTIDVNPDRIVTLTGVVESEQKREQAKAIASGVAGVSQVKDVLFIAPPSAGPMKIR